MGEICVECTGEGVVLVDPSGALPAIATAERPRTPTRPEPVKASPPPPPPPAATEGSGILELDVVKNADWLTDGEDGDKPDGGDAPTSDEH